ncbi:MAG: methyltransferase domain-containing protein [Gammaproteobacteria bacterium]|nr:methyltransferase domain-containing protein [Gammaproteobacteria bacterium]
MYSKSAPKDVFEQIALKYAKLVDTKPIHIYYERPNLLSLLPINIEGLNILDLGCGSGWYAEHLTTLGAKITAIDSSQTMVELTQKRVPECHVYLADLENPLSTLNNQSFDIIIAPLVIHYIKDWHVLFERLSKLLKHNGYFIFSTHAPHMEYIAFNLENYFQKALITDYWENIGEIKFYHHTLHELTESLYQSGFIIERMLEPMPLPEMEKADPKMYSNIVSKPWFLFVRAKKLN